LIDPQALVEIASDPDPSASRAFVLEFRADPPITGVTRGERMISARSAWAEVKRGLLERLASEPGVRVQDHDASPQAVVVAPARLWASWSEPGGVLATDPQVRVLPNTELGAL
jgi:hypothetical protein